MMKDDERCFRYAAIIVLNHEKFESYSEIISIIKSFINNCKWEGINYPSNIEYWERFEKNNATIALNVSHIKEKEICPTYTSKSNSSCKKQIILLLIPNVEEEDWYFLPLK